MADGIQCAKMAWIGLEKLANRKLDIYQSKLTNTDINACVFWNFIHTNVIVFFRLPQIKMEIGKLPGPFISKISHASSEQIRFTDSCPDNPKRGNLFYLRAKCPEFRCGVTRTNLFKTPKLHIRDEIERRKRDEYLRIVGGDRSGPHSWPYIVAIYKDGRFHCGGTIYTSLWVSFWFKTWMMARKSLCFSFPFRLSLLLTALIVLKSTIMKCMLDYYVDLASRPKFR